MPLRTLIVDDEPIARKVLREELDFLDDVEIIGEADNGALAPEKISADHPDLVLLDLQMPEMGGLEVVRNLKGGTHMPVIVIVTAYDQYALQAFEAGAIDYLLKPVSGEPLEQAVERAKRLTERDAAERLRTFRKSPTSQKVLRPEESWEEWRGVPLDRRQSDDQGGALQLPFHLQCNALRDPSHCDGNDRVPLLGPLASRRSEHRVGFDLLAAWHHGVHVRLLQIVLARDVRLVRHGRNRAIVRLGQPHGF